MGMCAGMISGWRSPHSHRLVDDGGHQAQDAARALKFYQCGPVRVEPVEDFWMDRIGGAYSALVVGVSAFGRELLLLGAVEVGKGAREIALGRRATDCARPRSKLSTLEPRTQTKK